MIRRVAGRALGAQRLGTTLALFTADWCPFCDAFAPVFARASERSRVPFTVVDISDVSSPVWSHHRIEVVPTLIAFRAGAEVARADGVLGRGLEERDVLQVVAALEAP